MHANPHSTRLVLGAIFILTLAACGKKEQAATQTAAQNTTNTQAATTVVEEPALSTLTVEELLKRGKVAESKDQLVAPAGDNAVEYYLTVIEKEPNNAIAAQAIIDIFPLATGVVERQLQTRNVEEADRVIQMLGKAQPDSYTVKTLAGRLDALKDAVVREEQQRLAEEERARLAAEQAARQAALPAAEQVATQERAAQLAAQERAAREAQAAAASVAATEARETQATTTAATTTQPVAAATQPAGGETRNARLVRASATDYPPQALRRRQEGWVEIEATVAADGSVSEVTVIRSEPPRVFDREAANSAKRWQFDPALKNGQAVESKYRRRIEFKL